MGLLGKLTGADAANKQARGLAQKSEAQKQAALGELTPESFQEFLNFFLPLLNAQSAPAMQFALSRLGNTAGRAGFSRGGSAGSGLLAQLGAGIPGQFAASNLSSALRTTLGLKTARAGIISGTPLLPNSAGRSALADITDQGKQLIPLGLDIGGAIAAAGKPNPGT